VFPEEPRPGAAAWENPYADEPRVACTPHIGAATEEAQPRIARRVANTMAGFSRYGSLRDCVFEPRAQLSIADEARGHAVLAVVHSTSRGTKKAVDDAIFEAGASNLGSVHRDFEIGVAYDLSVLDRALRREELDHLVDRAMDLAKDRRAIRAVRQIVVPREGW
jgi:D-3-phosphoglycerate dehydrogenase